MDLDGLDSKQARSLLRAALGEQATSRWPKDTAAGSKGEGYGAGPRSMGCGAGTVFPVPAAVLIATVWVPGEPLIVLTKRTANLENHAGEVSLPGGRVEPYDASPQETALREAFEEIGLAPEKVEILGSLPPYETVSGFRVTPYVGWVEPPVAFCPDPGEVEEVFTLPLRLVLDRDRWRREQMVKEGKAREFLVLDYEGRRIWGATAGILADLARVLTLRGK